MILSKFWFFTLVILLAIGLLILFINIVGSLEKLKEKNKPTTFKKNLSEIVGWTLVLYIPFIFIFYNWYAPNVYIIEKCNSYKTKILIFPKKTNNLNMELDSDNCYVINNSKSKIRLSSVVYDMRENETNRKLLAEIRGQEYKHISGLTMNDYKMMIDKNIYPKNSFMLKYKKIHYIFEQPDNSVSVKYETKVRYKLTCKY